ncbi:MBL fold metallo-hydrolase [Pseudoalteromonas sp. T1lg23B]|uniref:MBL fold metallo-hydrolase n=1 Tax=Pseudoalteromonas sp. T1lg23B TaxID=2077097 RepID=UPI000CF643B6|nr:MBL fold metallo-hydrolase [Pseudoalteromonas sp. T1lg23B]
MKTSEIYNSATHTWLVLGRDSNKPNNIIDTNQYLIKSTDEAIILDPGGIELFSPMLASILKHVTLEQVTTLFASHQDPDIISSLGLWDKALPKATLHAPWLWEGFIRHFGMDNISYQPIKDEGGEIKIGKATLRFVPAHYLHSSGNFNVYDPKAKILMSGDIGAALEKGEPPMFVEDFASHIKYMEYFHRRWMPSNRAKNDWISRVRELDIDIMAPQHGRIFKGEMVQEFLEWFSRLDVGCAYK